jgi:hypothetical protein
MDENFKTTQDLYEELFSKKECWNYYCENIEFPKTLNEYKEFCESFVKISGKSAGNPLANSLEHGKSKEHVFSVFILGLIIYNNCHKVQLAIDKKRNLYENKIPKSDLSFPYFWFMIALFHDSGYKFEDNQVIREIEDFKMEYKIKYSLKKVVGVPRYMDKIYENYFKCKLEQDLKPDIKKPDHGILGGLLLYDSLTNIYESNKPENFDEKEGYTKNGLHWSKKLLNIYNLCSWVILSHNIFYVRKGVDKEEFISLYVDFKMDDLILGEKENSKITLTKYPFLFLLCLVDTLEPYKMVNDPRLVVEKNYKMKFSDNSVEISFDNKKLEDLKKMSNWLAVDVNYNSANKVTITFK